MVDYTVTVNVDPATAKISMLVPAVRSALRGGIISWTQQLAALTRAKLTNNVLNIVSGRLLASIQSQMSETPTTITGRVFSQGLIYAAVHEYGGKGYYPIVPVRAKMLAWPDGYGGMVFRYHVNHPPLKMRSYLRSSLTELRDAMIADLTARAKAGAASASASATPS